MVPRGIQVQSGATYGDVIEHLQDEEKFCAIILAGKKVQGIFTERDALKRGLLPQADPDTAIDDIMTKNPIVVQEEDHLIQAIRLMDTGRYRHLPVVNTQEEFVGLLSVRDVVYYLAENYPDEVYNLPPDIHKFSGAPEGA